MCALCVRVVGWVCVYVCVCVRLSELVCVVIIIDRTPISVTLYSSVYKPFLLRGTLGQQYPYLAAPQDDKIGIKVNESDNWRHP